MKKNIAILLVGFALLSCAPASAASPPARDVGKVILVEDHSPASLSECLVIRATDLTNVIVLEAQAESHAFAEPAIKIETLIANIADLSGEVTSRDTGELSATLILSQLCKSNHFIKEKIYLNVCSIRQC